MKFYLVVFVFFVFFVVGLFVMVNVLYCLDGNIVIFVGLLWESGDFIICVVEMILKDGYDCKIDIIFGNLVMLEQVILINDIQIFVEEWVGCSEVWKMVVEQGIVLNIGDIIQGVMEGFFVFFYVIKGDVVCNIIVVVLDLIFVE